MTALGHHALGVNQPEVDISSCRRSDKRYLSGPLSGKPMTRAFAIVVFVLLASVARADSAGSAIHYDPGPGDNLRVYTFIGVPAVTITLDEGEPWRLPGKSVNFTRVAPRHHAAFLTTPDGSKTSLDFTLSTDDLIESKGRRWWCLMAGVRNDQLVMFQPTNAQCKWITDTGPN
jgi:hypothetical protein